MDTRIRKVSLGVVFLLLLLGISTFATQSAHAKTAPSAGAGKVIEISLSQQSLQAYEGGKDIFNTAILTGRPDLPTPTGTYHVLEKLSPTTFYSPWPQGSPNWYAPTPINYALEWKEGGYFMHDATWHTVFGPGTNTWHNDPVYGRQNGSHGCITMPLNAARWLYSWAAIGTPVQINP